MPRLAVLGQPVSHSRSPAMHSAALAEMGLGEWSYEAIEVSPEGFEALVSSLPEQGFAGVNVTVPHKLAALAVADEATDAAREIGAANTLTFAGGLHPGREHRRDRDRGPCRGRPRACVRWSWAPAARPGPRSGRSGRRAQRKRVESHAREGRGARRRAGRGPRRREPPDILVNATTVGLASAQ